MYKNYEHEQERLTSAAGQAAQTAVSVGAQLWMTRQRSLKVEIRTATQDVQDACKAIQQGTPKQKILESIRQGGVYQRIAKAGGDPQKYERLIVQRAEIDHAMEMMPTQAPAQVKTPKKKL
jgi:hypothetical protein